MPHSTQPDPATDADAGIPVLDLHSPNAASELLNAACKHGFIFIRHTGLDLTPQEASDMFKLSHVFFNLPRGVKMEAPVRNNLGWVSMHTEALDPVKQKHGDFKEAFNIGEYRNGQPKQVLPGPLAAAEAQIGSFMDKCHALCRQILTLLAEGLEISSEHGGRDWFSVRHDKEKSPSSSIFRLLYYPALQASAKNAPEDVRAGAHSDYGSVTLLFRLPGQPGLEILTPEGTWAPVPVNPSGTSLDGQLPILVNLGDILSYWTNGLLKSTVHRVVFPTATQDLHRGEDRYSIAYFCHPTDSTELTEIPSRLVPKADSGANGDRPMTAREHLDSRLKATYGL